MRNTTCLRYVILQFSYLYDSSLGYLTANVQIHNEPEIKGAFKNLQDRGIKIKDYRDGAGRTILQYYNEYPKRCKDWSD
jgi:hypothetical protein